MLELHDQDILSRLTNFEDAFVERKSTGDIRDLLKTAVAFANSTPIGYPAILFYGVTDKGEPEGKANLDTLQKTISDKLKEAYPAIYYSTKVIERDGKQFLAVIIPGSANRPHFAGQSYIRDGSQTVVASKEQFERLIVERNSKARELLKWRGRDVTISLPSGYPRLLGGNVLVGGGIVEREIVDCTQFYVTVKKQVEQRSEHESYPLDSLQISYDHDKDRLKLRIE